jgi:carbonic anhydrase
MGQKFLHNNGVLIKESLSKLRKQPEYPSQLKQKQILTVHTIIYGVNGSTAAPYLALRTRQQ